MNELLTVEEMAEADRMAIAGGIPSLELMENAGRAVAEAVIRDHSQAMPRVCVVAGPGNNGGDGFVAARILAARGLEVRVLLLGDPARLKGDAAEAARRWQGEVIAAAPAAISGCGLIVDALFGAGLDRPVQGEAAAMIGAMNAAGVPILAVDLPSGVNGSTGAVMGEAVRANKTVTFFRRKLGHVLMPGRMYCGPVEVADIGIPDTVLDAIKPQARLNDPELWGRTFPIPDPRAHKYARGHAVVVSGGLSFTGAARLPIGPLWTDPLIREQFLLAVQEVERVARAEGVALPDGVLDRLIRYVDALPPSTRSSLLIDLQMGKRIELESLAGSVVRRGMAAGVPTPIMAALYAVLRPWRGQRQ